MPMSPDALSVPQLMSLPADACSTPVIAGACQWVLLPSCVVLTQTSMLLVAPRTGDRSLGTCTADWPVCLAAPFPLNDRSALPMRPGATQTGSGEPVSVPLFPLTESAVVVPV